MGKNESLGCNSTSKFAVLDAPGVSQPEPVTAAAPAAAPAAKQGLQGRRAKASAGPKMDSGSRLGGDCFTKRTANPEWLQKRLDVYKEIEESRAAELAMKKPVDISVTMPDGNVLTKNKAGEPFQAWKTTPFDVAATISQGLADASTVARVTYASFADDYSPAEDGMDGEDTLMDAMADAGLDQEEADDKKVMLWDMTRPLVGPVAKLELLKFNDDRDAKTVFWHSSAHMMGEALEHLYGCKLTIGPPLAGGFYYDSYMGDDTFKDDDRTFVSEFSPLFLFASSRLTFLLFFLNLQTSLSRPKCKRLSRQSKNSSAWSLPRKKV